MSVTHIDIDGAAIQVQGLGPGERVVIWLRGCSRGCEGCIAPELWATGVPTPIDEVVEWLLPELAASSGLTVSGGEPMDQPEALLQLFIELRLGLPKLELMVYSGYLLEELKGKSDAHDQILEMIDILADGAFELNSTDHLQWRGSDNQRIHLLSEHAQRHRGNVDLPWPEQRPIQVQMCTATEYRVIGIPKRGGIEQYRELMRQRGIEVGPSV